MSKSITRRVLLGALSCAVAATQLCAATATDAGKKTVFRIGTFDRSSVEFASEDPTAKVNFEAAKSKTEKDWYGYQPAISGVAGKAQQATIAAAPRTISFSLEGSPAKAYRLHIALLVEGAAVPALRVGIDGKNGIFYLHPKLDYSNGDQGDSFYPAYSSADVEFTFPGNYLQAGANTLTLQPVEESEETIPGAGINYDAIELESLNAAGDSLSPSAQLMPTIFFTGQQGELQETLEAFIQHYKPITPGTGVDLAIGNKNYHASLSGGHDFGEEKVTFQVSDFPAQSEARLTAKIDGREEHFKQTIDPKKKWTVLIVPHIHVDIGYSDYQAKIAAMSSSLIPDRPAEAAANFDLPLVVFRLGSEAYSLRLHEVREIIMVGNITPIPRAPSFIDGVLNLRGEVMPVIDLRERFGLPRQPVTSVSRIVITPIGGVGTGLIVDSVEEVKSVDQRRLEDPPKVTAVGANAFIEKVARVDQNVIFLLNVQCLLTEVEGQQLQVFQGKKKG